MPLPIGGPLEPSLYLQPFSTYLAQTHVNEHIKTLTKTHQWLNTQTNKHDGSQYLLSEVITITLFRRKTRLWRYTPHRHWRSGLQTVRQKYRWLRPLCRECLRSLPAAASFYRCTQRRTNASRRAIQATSRRCRNLAAATAMPSPRQRMLQTNSQPIGRHHQDEFPSVSVKNHNKWIMFFVISHLEMRACDWSKLRHMTFTKSGYFPHEAILPPL